VLFEIDGSGKEAEGVIAYQVQDMRAPADVASFGRELARGCMSHLVEVDAAVASASDHWQLDDCGKVERAVLRLGTYELLCEAATPVAVIIDESVELAKAYAGQDAAGFVNGVLGQVAGGVRV
jgi:N utilization substance protein B